MKGDFAKFGLTVGAAGVVIGAVATQMKKAVDATVTYADEVRTLSSVTNQSAEETSKMIQVLDDYKISSQQAGSAARFLAKEGLSLNIETLAELSDSYKKLNTGQEKATFLMKNFGKAGQDFALIMDQGSEAILRQGDAVNKGLILTQEQMDKARELEIATDDLEDSKQALYVTLGTKLIPTWVDYLDSLNRVVSGENALSVMAGNVLWMFKDTKGAVDSATQSYMAMAKSMPSIAAAIEDTESSIRGLSDAEESFLLSTRDMTPKAVAEFVTLQTKIAEVKKMIAAGASFNVIVNFLAGRTIMVNPESMAPTQQQFMASQAAATQTAARNKVITKSGGLQKATGGPLGAGYTLVGEAGPELISPSGMVINAHNTRRMLGRGWRGGRMAVGGKMIPDPWEPRNTPKASGGYNLADDWVMMGMPNAPQNWVTNYNASHGGGGGGGGGGASAVIQTAVTATQAASQSAQQTSRAVDVTAQMSQQIAQANAVQAASLASIDRRLANLPTQIRDAFQQVIQQ